jgi:hypothetical protein
MLTYADVQVMESARMVFEGLCTRAILLAQKEALKGMGIDEQRLPPPKHAPHVGSSKTHVSFGTSEAKSRRYVCSRMLTYAHVCSRMLTYGDGFGGKLLQARLRVP